MSNSWQRIFRRPFHDPCTWNPSAIDIFSFVSSVIVPLFCWMQALHSIRHRMPTVPPDSLPDIDCFWYHNLRSSVLRLNVFCVARKEMKIEEGRKWNEKTECKSKSISECFQTFRMFTFMQSRLRRCGGRVEDHEVFAFRTRLHYYIIHFVRIEKYTSSIFSARTTDRELSSKFEIL